MPELPELEVIAEVLRSRVVGLPIRDAEVRNPIILRTPGIAEFRARICGTSAATVERRAKFLIFHLTDGCRLVVNPMLAGRFQLTEEDARLRADTLLRIFFTDGRELRYADAKQMGKIYLVSEKDLASVPQLGESGPEPLDARLTQEVFRSRLRKHSGMIKNVLTNHRFVAGIGNAYADEILHEAGLLPFRKRAGMNDEQVVYLYRAMRLVLEEAIGEVRERMGEEIDQKPREFLKVHGKGGQACPDCGHVIAEVRANRRLTNFCRGCQS